MNTLLYAGATSLLFSFLLMPLLIRFLQSRKLMDKGGNRKIHKGFIPSMGGIVIVVAFVTAMLLWLPIEDMAERRYRFVGIALVFLTGIRDDMVPLRPLHKLIAQIVAALIVVIPGDIRIPSLYGLFGIEMLPMWLSYTISIFFIVFITNAFNLIDGIDGLAGSVAIVAFSFLCFWFYATGSYSSAISLICIIGATLGFLYYNWQPASIFMGDTGSLVLGYILSFCTISFISANGQLPADNDYHFPAVLSAGIAIVILPLYDTTRVFMLRIRQGKSPFRPDKQHTHHLVLYMRHKSHNHTVLNIIASYVAVGAMLLTAAKFMPDWVLLPVIIIIYFILNQFLKGSINKTIEKKREKNHQLIINGKDTGFTN